MKKSVVILLVMALIAVTAYAQDAGIKLGGWGRSGVELVKGSSAAGVDPVVAMFPQWANGARVGFNVNGNSANVGFNMNVDNNAGSIGIGDQAKIWVQPHAMVKVELGKIQCDVLRGKFGSFNVWSSDVAGEDDLFARFYPGSGGAGVMISITPADGLFLGAGFNGRGDGDYDGNSFDSDDANDYATLQDTYSAIQVGAGYKIAGVGQVRAQYVGSAVTDGGRAELAFQYNGMAGLNVDVGTKIAFAANSSIPVNLAGSYSAGALGASLRFKGVFGEAAGSPLNMGVNATITYALAAPLSAGLNITWKSEGMGNSIYFAPFVRMGLAQGYTGIGFTFQQSLATGGSSTYAIPLYVEYWF